MNPLDYLKLQLKLEGKEIINDNLLRQVEVIPDEEVPLLLIAQLADENLVTYFDEASQAELRDELKKQVPNIIFPNIDSLFTLLRSRELSFEIGHYKTYIFPKTYSTFKDEAVICYSKFDLKIKEFGFDGFAEHVYSIEQDGKIISACVSTHENDFCGEAWVYTDPEYRNQGFAQRIVSAWAGSLISAGKIPFYSHKIQNVASANLAKHLELQSVFEEIVIKYKGLLPT